MGPMSSWFSRSPRSEAWRAALIAALIVAGVTPAGAAAPDSLTAPRPELPSIQPVPAPVEAAPMPAPGIAPEATPAQPADEIDETPPADSVAVRASDFGHFFRAFTGLRADSTRFAR